MLVIRFVRIGKRHQPSFRMVATEKKSSPVGGRFVEQLGFWNPLTKEKILKKEKIKYWISKGAQPSDSVYNLLIKEGVLEGKKRSVHKKSKKKEEEKKEEAKEEKKVAEKPAEEPEEKPEEGK